MNYYLRITKRRSSRELTDAREFCQMEFPAKDKPGLDLRLSVYATDGSRAQSIRMHAEHIASCGLNPNPSGHFDVTAILPSAPAPVDDQRPFSFTRAAHHEIPFASEDELLSFAQSLLSRVLFTAVSLPEVREYVKFRLSNGDREWLRFKADFPTTNARKLWS